MKTNDPSCSAGLSASDVAPDSARRSIHISISNLSGWCFFNSPKLENPFPEDETVTCFWAKGDENTKELAAEWVERDGSRWIATVDVTGEWKHFALSPSEFKYHTESPTGNRRKKVGDVFNPKNADHIAFGVALPYLGWASPWKHRHHEFWISELGSSKSPLGDLEPARQVVLDTLSPSYRFFPIPKGAVTKVNPAQAIMKKATFPPSYSGFSSSPRPQGTGFLKHRKWRWVPLVNAYNKKGERCGTLATLLVHGSPPYGQSAWACFATDEPQKLKVPTLAKMLADVAARICKGIYLYEAGSQHYTYFQGDEVRLGATLVNFSNKGIPQLGIRIEIRPKGKREPAFEREFTFALDAGEDRVVECVWKSGTFTYRLYDVETRLLMDGKVIDVASHEMGVWEPKPLEEREYVTCKDGRFFYRGQPWFAHGVNYMPSSGIAIEDGEYFEYWMSARSYDPEVIELDLSRIERMGMNAVSVFIYHRDLEAMNLLDLLRRCENHGIMVNLSLRPHADPRQFRWEEVEALIKRNRIAENDTVFAYGIAWERGWGTYDGSYGNPRGRKGYDEEWKAWIEERYASIQETEADWGYPVPRKDGEITGPSDEQLMKDGEWRRMVAAYRRFVDDYTGKIHLHVVRKIKSIDPYHLVSFRMSTSGDPTCDPRTFPYDFKGLAGSMDIMSPEGYGRIGDWDRVRDGCFTAAYARHVAPGKPVFWQEFGVQIWQGTNFDPDPDPAKRQAEYYDHFYRMILMSGATGAICWWHPGGFRVNENSDFGVIEPNGEWRPVSKTIEKFGSIVSKAKEIPGPDCWIKIDRDEHVDGLFGIYKKVRGEFWRRLEEGGFPGLKTVGTGTSSADTPPLAVGNTKCNGKNPPKYLNGQFGYVKIRSDDSDWMDVENGGLIEVSYDRRVYAKAGVINTEEAKWLSPLMHNAKTGTVYLSSRHGDIEFRQPISEDTPYLKSVEIGEFELSKSITSRKEVVFELTALDRAWFGEKFRVSLVPTG